MILYSHEKKTPNDWKQRPNYTVQCTTKVIKCHTTIDICTLYTPHMHHTVLVCALFVHYVLWRTLADQGIYILHGIPCSFALMRKILEIIGYYYHCTMYSCLVSSRGSSKETQLKIISNSKVCEANESGVEQQDNMLNAQWIREI